MFFKHFGSKNQLPGLSIIGTLVENGLRKAHCHNARTSQDMKYYTGDIVYHKKRNSNHWKGPGTVGQDGQHVLVKHSSTYIRVHPCQLQLLNTAEEQELNTCLNENDSENTKISRSKKGIRQY